MSFVEKHAEDRRVDEECPRKVDGDLLVLLEPLLEIVNPLARDIHPET